MGHHHIPLHKKSQDYLTVVSPRQRCEHLSFPNEVVNCIDICTRIRILFFPDKPNIRGHMTIHITLRKSLCGVSKIPKNFLMSPEVIPNYLTMNCELIDQI
jgi:hypothetical protein